MKKVITAIGDPSLNVKLKKEENIEIISEDIQYQDGILEILEKDSNINFIILSELIPGNFSIKELIEKIKIINNNIQIILFLEKNNEELENYLYAKGVNFIFYNNQIETEEIVKIIETNKTDPNIELKKQIEELKKMLTEKEKQPLHKIIKKENKKEIICVSGTSGVGKSIFTVNLAKSLKQNKILIIDFDVLNNSLHTILGVKKYPEKIRNKINEQKTFQVEELAIKINSKIDLISGINLLFDSKFKISGIKVRNILERLKNIYDVIIIDTSSECFFDYTKEIMILCNLNIFITEANLVEIRKAKNLLNIYINSWKIPQRNFNILFNKYNKNSVDISILKHVFEGFKILGKLYTNEKYNLIINKNSKGNLDKKMQKEYAQILKKIS